MEAPTVRARPGARASVVPGPGADRSPAPAGVGAVTRRGAASGPAIEVRRVAAGYGGATVLHDLDLEVARGELLALVGPSGSGKTSLLKLVTGQLHLHGGDVTVLGQRVRRRAPAGIGYVPQLGTVDLDVPLSVEQVVLLGDAASSGLRPWFTRSERAAARQVLDRLGLGGLHRRQLRELSGGQLQRAFLARALARRCELLLLDEPTSGVDVATRRDVLALVDQLHAQDDLTVVLTTHDLNLVATHLPRLVCVADGRVVADGSPEEVLTPVVLERTYGAPMRVLRDGDRLVVVDDVAPRSVPPLADEGTVA